MMTKHTLAANTSLMALVVGTSRNAGAGLSRIDMTSAAATMLGVQNKGLIGHAIEFGHMVGGFEASIAGFGIGGTA